MRNSHENRTNQIQINFDPESEKAVPSTLLLPAQLSELLKRRLSYHEIGLSHYFRFLLTHYRGHLLDNVAWPTGHAKTLYQSDDTFIRKSVRTSPLQWFYLGQIARALGISKCYVFSLLLQIEAGVLEIEGVPTLRQYPYSPVYVEFADPVYDKITRILYKTINNLQKARWAELFEKTFTSLRESSQ